MALELVTHARQEVAQMGGQMRDLLAWWLGISFGVLGVVLGLAMLIFPVVITAWGGVLIGLWLLAMALCRCADLLTDSARGVQRLPGAFSAVAGLALALAVMRGFFPIGGELSTVVAIALGLNAFADAAGAARLGLETQRGWRTRFGVRAAAYLPATIVFAISAAADELSPYAIMLAAVATGLAETCAGAVTGIRSMRRHIAAEPIPEPVTVVVSKIGRQRVAAVRAAAGVASRRRPPPRKPVRTQVRADTRPAGRPAIGRATVPAVGRARVVAPTVGAQ